MSSRAERRRQMKLQKGGKNTNNDNSTLKALLQVNVENRILINTLLDVLYERKLLAPEEFSAAYTKAYANAQNFAKRELQPVENGGNEPPQTEKTK